MIFLAYLDGHALPAQVPGPWQEVRELRPGLVFVESDQSRSVVYHALKDALPHGAALLVAELQEIPKFKGMRPGSLAWARARLPGRRGR